MTSSLPPNLLALFAPRDPIPFKEPVDKLPHEKTRVPIQGISQYITLFEVSSTNGRVSILFYAE